MVATLSLALAACGGDSTGPTPYQGAPCAADVASAIRQYGEPASMSRTREVIERDGGSMTFVQGGDTIVYTFRPHYDDTYWCEMDVDL